MLIFLPDISKYLERSSHVEERTQKENQQLLKEAQREIQERDEKLDDLRMEYESKLKVHGLP